jgi:hypothetical protein
VNHPIDQILRVKVKGTLDSGHLKPGKELWFTVAGGMAYPGCTLEEDSVVYAHVTSASSSKNPNASELSLVFDHADCAGHAKQELKMRLIGLVLKWLGADAKSTIRWPTQMAWIWNSILEVLRIRCAPESLWAFPR